MPLAEVANEHRIFFPYVGLSLAVVWWVALQTSDWLGNRIRWRAAFLRAAWVLAIFVLCGHAFGTYQRNKVWYSGETLWRDVIEKSSANGRALMNYGLTQMSQGKYVQAKRLFERAKIHVPNYAHLQTNLGIVDDKLGDKVSAERHFVRALQLQADFPEGHYYYAHWLVDQGRSRQAIPRLQRAIRLSPSLSHSRKLLMNLYFAQGARAQLSALVKDTLGVLSTEPTALVYAGGEIPFKSETPSSVSYYNMGFTFTKQERHLDAAVAYRQALKFQPVSADALNNLGWSLGKLGFFPEAIPLLEQALQLRPAFTLAQNNLAWVRSNVKRP